MSQIITTKPAKPRNYKRALSIFVAVVVIASAIIFSYLLYRERPLYASIASQQSYNLAGEQKGMGMSFLKPVGAQAAIDLPSTKNYMEFAQNVTRSGKTYTIAYEAASVSPPFTPDAGRLKQLNSLAPKPQNSSDKADFQNAAQFLTTRIHPRYTILMSSAAKFTNANITQNAVVISFTAVDKTPKAKPTPNKLTGKLVIAAGKKNFYYLMIAANDKSWQTDKTSWSKILDSLKIDQ